VLVVARLRDSSTETRTYSNLLISAAVVGMLALLIAPTAWASYNVFQGGGGGGPMVGAGPRPAESEGGPGGPGGPLRGGPPGGPGGPGGDSADTTLVEYLQANKGDAEYLVATTDAHRASSLILNTDERVIDMNGFEGHDPVFTADEVTRLVDEGAVRSYLVGGPGGSDSESASWIQDNCQQVPQGEWQSSSDQGGSGPPGRNQALYDCGTGGR
jgi:hypothetical protein